MELLNIFGNNNSNKYNMKHYLISMICLLLSIATYSQSPQSFQYQAVVRDVSGNALTNQPVSFQLSIIEGVLPGTVVYVETHAATTNAFGIVTLSVGNGIPVTNLFSSINWSLSPHFIKVEADPTGGTSYIDMGTTQLLSVPYAMYAQQAGNAGQTYTAGNGIDITGTVITNTSPDQTVTLTQGGSTTISGTYPNFTINSTDLNTGTPGGLNKTVQFNNSGTFGGDTAMVWDNTNKRLGVGLANPNGRVVIKGSSTAPANEPLFEIKNKDGQQVMVVYNDSIHFFITDAASNQGGFAVSGRSNAKAITDDFLRISRDSTRIWTADTLKGFGVKNIGSTSKTSYMQLTPKNYFIGHQAGEKITTGKYNSFIGYQSGFNNTIGNKNYFIGFRSGYSNLNGYSNVFVGDSAGFSNTIGKQNIFVGNECGTSNIKGSYNVFLGFQSGHDNLGLISDTFNLTGSYNTFLGFQSGYHNTEGNINVAVGNQSLYMNTTGDGNVGVGYWALLDNSTGYFNTAIGSATLINNTTGYHNSAMGYEAMAQNTSGFYNAAVGYNALFYNTNGNNNSAFGVNSGYHNTTGTYNSALGRNALQANTTGSNNTAVGYNAFSTGTAYTNSTAVGANAAISASNQVVFGNNGVTSLYCMGAYAATSANAANVVVLNTGQILRSTSSKRYKKDIENLKINTEDIYKLRPVSYISIMDNKPYFGLVAEEVAEVIPELAEYAIEKQVIPGSNSDKMIPDAVKYPILSVLLLSEMQKHQKKITELMEKNDLLVKENSEQKLLINQLIQRIETIENKIK